MRENNYKYFLSIVAYLNRQGARNYSVDMNHGAFEVYCLNLRYFYKGNLSQQMLTEIELIKSGLFLLQYNGVVRVRTNGK